MSNCTFGGGEGGATFGDSLVLGSDADESVGSGWAGDGAGDLLSGSLLASSDAVSTDADSSLAGGAKAIGMLHVIVNCGMLGVGVWPARFRACRRSLRRKMPRW
jgi:hypothetical protein